MNGFLSLLKYGHDFAYGGFGVGRGGAASTRRLGDTGDSTGRITYRPHPSKNSTEVIDELATLLTSGRLSNDKRTLLRGVYEDAMLRGAPQEALINVEQLVILTPEFNTNGLSQNNGGVFPQEAPLQASSTPYKAVIYVMLEGGYDSFNMLVPNVCSGRNRAAVRVHDQYKSERGDVGFTDDERTLTIDVDPLLYFPWNQPCSEFALHDELSLLKELYDDRDLIFLANAGVVGNAGMNKTNYRDLTKPQLFAHNAMQRETKTVDPKLENPGSGVLGRLAEVLNNRGFKAHSVSIDNLSVAVTPKSGAADENDPITLSRNGITPFAPNSERENLKTKRFALELNAQSSRGSPSSLYGENFSRVFVKSIRQAERLKTSLDQAQLGPHWPKDVTDLGKQFQMISKLIQTRDQRGTDRDFFFSSQDGWDHHDGLKYRLRAKFQMLNQALRWLVDELKHQGAWGDVAIVVASDFGRTMTPNTGGGTDHAWGGNYMIMGGSVNGGTIRGQYPSDITPTSPLNIGRGRLMPTMSWDAIWNGVSEWMGASTDAELDYCLPNRRYASGNGLHPLLRASDLFDTTSRRLRSFHDDKKE